MGYATPEREVLMATVEIRSLVKRFGSVRVLHGIDATIEDRSFVVLLGPSGCGKSTLLRMIAGLEAVTEGEIAIGGRVVNNLPPKHRDLAMVFQNYALYPHMKVFDNMAFSLKLARVDSVTIKQKVLRAAEILNLTEYLDRYPRQLSGGQRQRVAMGRAIVRNPQVFLFDEPLSNLDAQLRVQMRTEIKGLHQRLGSTSIYVTHDQIEAMTMADKIVVMREGRIEQAGPPLEVYDHPRNLFVAAFLGSPTMNLIAGTLRGNDTSRHLITNDGATLPLPGNMPGRDGQSVYYGVRPDHLTVANTGGFEAIVEVVEPTGADTLVFASIGDQKICGAFAERHAFRPGECITLAPRLDCVHLFDAQSGINLMLS
jgi:multiple sugar transport system ATP-binding protein